MDDQKDDIPTRNEFDQPEDATDDTVQGGRWKFDSGVWYLDGVVVEHPKPQIAERSFTLIQRWEGGELLEEIKDLPLPNVKLLNAAVPRPWPLGLSGTEEPPYNNYRVVYFRDPETMARSTYISKAGGAARAVSEVNNLVRWKRRLHGSDRVFPLVQLGWAPWPTKYGMKKRPDYRIINWIDLSTGASLPPASEPKQLSPTKPATAKQIGPAPDDIVEVEEPPFDDPLDDLIKDPEVRPQPRPRASAAAPLLPRTRRK
jgi:hypothetical protein